MWTAFFHWRVYLFWLSQSNMSIFCITSRCLWSMSLLQLDGEWWNCLLGSSLSCSDCAYKASRKLGAVNRGQAVLQAVKQLCVWLKTTLSWNINIPAGPRRALSPYSFTGRHDGSGGSQQLGQDGEGGDSFMAWQEYWKWYLYGASKGGGYCGGAPTGRLSSECKCAASQMETHANSSLIQLRSWFYSFGNHFCYLW